MHQPTAHLVLLILSLMFAGLATAGVPGRPNFQLFPAAFFCFVLAAFFI